MVKNSVKGLVMVLLMVVAAVTWIGRAAAIPGSCDPLKTFPLTECVDLAVLRGCYILQNDLAPVPPRVDCLVLKAAKITVDLHGFSITGPGSGVAGSQGITDGGIDLGARILSCSDTDCTSSLNPNGLITGFRIGVDLAASKSNEIRNLEVTSNRTGITVGANSMVKDSLAHDNDNDGIVAADFCTVQNNDTSNGNRDGISVGNHCLVTGNTSNDNNRNGIVAGDYCTVTNNTATGNDNGIVVGGKCLVKNNFANDNNLAGIDVAALSTLGGNTVDSNFAKNAPGAPNNNVGIGVNCDLGLPRSTVTNNQASGTDQNYDPPGLETGPCKLVDSCYACNNIDP
jgi:parallel beta-helix repeat protein